MNPTTAPASQNVRRSSAQRALLALATLGPLGYLPASGTATVALLGGPLFWLMQFVPTALQAGAAAVFALAAVGLHDWGDRVLGEKDSRRLVWDEIAGFLAAIVGVPFTWQSLLAAFLIERTLDISKFPPANWVERRVPGGWGVVGDDVVAGLYTCGILHALTHWAPVAEGLA